MKYLKKLWENEKVKDVIVRTLKTALVAGLSAVSTLGLSDWKTYAITFGSAFGTALINALLQILKKQVPNT